MAQFARPDTIIAADSWTGAATDIDESVASDADFIFSINNPNNTVQIGLSNVTDPTASSGHILRVRLTRGDADGSTPDAGGTATDYAIALVQGGTTIASIGTTQAPTTWTTVELNLSGAEADAITDYTDLRVHVTATGGAGAPASRRNVAVSWVELEVPSAPSVESGSFTADACVMATTSASITADAVIDSGTFEGSFTSDAKLDLVGVPSWISPADDEQISPTPVLVFSVPVATGDLWFNLQLDLVDTFDGPALRDLNTVFNQADFEYWDGDSWEPLPGTGLPAGPTMVRYTVSTPLSSGTWYRRVRAGTTR